MHFLIYGNNAVCWVWDYLNSHTCSSVHKNKKKRTIAFFYTPKLHVADHDKSTSSFCSFHNTRIQCKIDPNSGRHKKQRSTRSKRGKTDHCLDQHANPLFSLLPMPPPNCPVTFLQMPCPAVRYWGNSIYRIQNQAFLACHPQESPRIPPCTPAQPNKIYE